mgnify:CR=1 FL=1
MLTYCKLITLNSTADVEVECNDTEGNAIQANYFVVMPMQDDAGFFYYVKLSDLHSVNVLNNTSTSGAGTMGTMNSVNQGNVGQCVLNLKDQYTSNITLKQSSTNTNKYAVTYGADIVAVTGNRSRTRGR